MRVLLALALVVALSHVAVAQECVVTTSTPNLTVHAVGGFGLYVIAAEGCQPDCFSPCFLFPCIWQESNGIPGLQRADEFRDNTCGGQVPGDDLVFFEEA